jgi:hypothetical protein
LQLIPEIFDDLIALQTFQKQINKVSFLLVTFFAKFALFDGDYTIIISW